MKVKVCRRCKGANLASFVPWSDKITQCTYCGRWATHVIEIKPPISKKSSKITGVAQRQSGGF